MQSPDSQGTKPKQGEGNSLVKKMQSGDDHQFEVLGALVRLGVVIWSGAILTLTYVQVPGLPQQKIDPTFIASVFTGALATFGVQSTQKRSGESNGGGSSPPKKKEE